MRFIKKEYLILYLSLLLVTRNRKKYLKIVGITYLLGSTKICSAAKPAYFFCRMIDDCADGDLKPNKLNFPSFLAMINHFRNLLQDESTYFYPADYLLRDLIIKTNLPDVEVKSILLDFLEAMKVEYERRISSQILDERSLLTVHKNSFYPVLQLAFLALNTPYDLEILDQLTLIQSKVYSIQDIKSDLNNGIINLPREVISNSTLDHKILRDPLVKLWIVDQLIMAKDIGDSLLSKDTPPKTKKLIKTLVNPIMKDLDALIDTYISNSETVINKHT